MVPKRKKQENSGKMLVLAVTGTPGTGKTTISRKLAKKLKFKRIDLNQELKKSDLNIGKDEKRDSYIIEERKIWKKVKEIIKKAEKNGEKGVIIDSHLSHFAHKKDVDLCILCKCELKELKKRLEKRGYSEDKVKENIEAEIFEICKEEAKNNGHKILEIDCTKIDSRTIQNLTKRIRDYNCKSL